VSKRRRETRRTDRFVKRLGQIIKLNPVDESTVRERNKEIIKECQWRYIYNEIVVRMILIADRYKFSVFPRSSVLAVKYHKAIENLITILFERPVKDLQNMTYVMAETECRKIIYDLVATAVKYDISNDSGVKLALKSFLFTLKHGFFIAKMERKLMEVYEDSVFFYKNRDEYFIDEYGYVLMNDDIWQEYVEEK